jgi:hypothetical protein
MTAPPPAASSSGAFQGQTAVATIAQTDVLTAAQATQERREAQAAEVEPEADHRPVPAALAAADSRS